MYISLFELVKKDTDEGEGARRLGSPEIAQSRPEALARGASSDPRRSKIARRGIFEWLGRPKSLEEGFLGRFWSISDLFWSLRGTDFRPFALPFHSK